jgi:hypothetical protein
MYVKERDRERGREREIPFGPTKEIWFSCIWGKPCVVWIFKGPKFIDSLINQAVGYGMWWLKYSKSFD